MPPPPRDVSSRWECPRYPRCVLIREPICSIMAHPPEAAALDRERFPPRRYRLPHALPAIVVVAEQHAALAQQLVVGADVTQHVIRVMAAVDVDQIGAQLV